MCVCVSFFPITKKSMNGQSQLCDGTVKRGFSYRHKCLHIGKYGSILPFFISFEVNDKPIETSKLYKIHSNKRLLSITFSLRRVL